MMSTLTDKLQRLGFKDVSGTFEICKGEKCLVGCQTPLKWDFNQGATVVVDDRWRPWVKPGKHVPSKIGLDLDDRRDRGAYVPHSNDGGMFLANIFPALPVQPRQLQGNVFEDHFIGSGSEDIYKMRPGTIFTLRKGNLEEQPIFVKLAFVGTQATDATILRPNNTAEGIRRLEFRGLWGQMGGPCGYPLTKEQLPNGLSAEEKLLLEDVKSHAALTSDGIFDFFKRQDIIGGNVSFVSEGIVYRGVIAGHREDWGIPRLQISKWVAAPTEDGIIPNGSWRRTNLDTENEQTFCSTAWFFRQIDDNTAQFDSKRYVPWLRPKDYRPTFILTTNHPGVYKDEAAQSTL